jgi:hypothetical protein
MQNILNQPIQFGLKDKYLRESEFSQLVKSGDKINFQLLAGLGDNLITSGLGNYTQDPVSQWTSTYGLTKPLGNSGELYQDVLTANEYYRVDFEIVDISISGVLSVSIGTNLVGTFNKRGSYTVYGQATGNTRVTFEALSDVDVSIADTVSASLVESGKALYKIDLQNLNFSELTSEQTAIYSQNLIYRDISIPDTECYKLALGENTGSELIIDGGFDFPESWDVNAGLQISSSTLNGLNLTSANQNNATQSIMLPDNTFGLAIEGNLAGISNNVLQANIYQDGVLISSGEFTAAVTETITLGVPSGGAYTFELKAVPSSGSNSVDMRSVSVKPYVADLISNNFKTTTEETILLAGLNDTDTFGFRFDDDFNFTLRLEANLQEQEADDDLETYKDSQGNRQIVFSESQEIQVLAIGLTPVYIHRAIAKMRLLNTFLVDGTEYVIFDEDYDIQWNRNSDIAASQFSLVLKQQDYFN